MVKTNAILHQVNEKMHMMVGEMRDGTQVIREDMRQARMGIVDQLKADLKIINDSNDTIQLAIPHLSAAGISGKDHDQRTQKLDKILETLQRIKENGVDPDDE